MRRVKMAAIAVLLLGFVLTVPSSAGWVDDTVDDIIADVDRLVVDVGNLPTRINAARDEVFGRVAGVKADLEEMLPTFRDGYRAVDGDLDRLIDLCLVQAAGTARNELANMEAFLGSPAEQALRDRLRGLIDALELGVNDVLGLLPEFAPPCGRSRGLDLRIDLTPARNLVDNVPGPALYPLFRAQQILGNLLEELEARTACMREYWNAIVRVLRDEGSTAEYDEAYVAATLAPAKIAAKALWVRFQLLSFVGGQMEAAAKSAKIDGEVAIWGWVGGGIDVDAAGSLGTLLSTLGKVDKWLWELLDGRIKQQELLAYQNRMLAGQAEIIANQKKLIRAMWANR